MSLLFSARSATLVAVSVALLSACEVAPFAAEAGSYEACRDYFGFYGGERNVCADGVSVCRPSPDEFGDGICTTECSTSDDCQPFDGAEVVCERFARGGQLCVVRCDPDAEGDSCPTGNGCVEMDPVEDGPSRGYCLP